MLTDKLYNERKNKLGENWILIKEYQFFGFCPTWKNTETGEILYNLWNKPEFFNKTELYNYLIEYWQPVSYEDQRNFLNLKGIIFSNEMPYFSN